MLVPEGNEKKVMLVKEEEVFTYMKRISTLFGDSFCFTNVLKHGISFSEN